MKVKIYECENPDGSGEQRFVQEFEGDAIAVQTQIEGLMNSNGKAYTAEEQGPMSVTVVAVAILG